MSQPSYETFKAQFPGEQEIVHLIARDTANEETIGVCQYLQINRVGWIRMLYVREDWRCHGVASRFIEMCREIAERNQMDSLTLNVRTENQTAKAVCLKRGFRHVANGEIWSLTP